MQGLRYREEAGKVRFDARLREKGGGVLEGSPLNTFKKQASAAGIELRQYKPEGGERWHDVMLRAQSYINSITEEFLPSKASVKASKGQVASKSNIKVLTVTHGGFIGEFLNCVKLLEGKQAVYDNSAKNTAMFIVRFERNAKDGLKPKLIMKNDNSHLQLNLREAKVKPDQAALLAG